tara:strand:+ start:896 stop:1243 length:348 start_codon:yes stop_codon:yes gene_type:complete
MALLSKPTLTEANKVNSLFVTSPSVPINDSLLNSVDGAENMTMLEKLYEVSKNYTERAKMTVGLLKFCDNVMAKPKIARDKVLRECNIKFAILTGDLFYKDDTSKRWPYANRYNY